MAASTRYRAFISYSHDDARDAHWLHRALETYRLPGRLVGKETAKGPVPRRLTPIFRDRDDLPASGDLSQSVRTALGQSDTLIVVCSPAAAASRWVNEEIRVFREVNPDGDILAAIVDGEPEAETTGLPPEQECFPPALLEPGESGAAVEPVAADMRRSGDGRRMALLKLVAGLLGLSLDQLIQRDLQRRQRRVTAVTVVSVLISVFMAGLTLFAVSAQSEAERRKAEAEDLIEFMLNDLRTRLEPVGRLDVLDAVGEKVIEYYDSQNRSQMSDDDLGRRATAFHLLGEIDSASGDLDGAYRHFTPAYEATSRILAVDPQSPARIYEHSQSAYWVGYFALTREDLDLAEARFIEYRDLSQRLVELEPDNVEYRTEAAYAMSNLGTLYAGQRRWQEAHDSKSRSVEMFQALAERDGAPPQAWIDLATGWAWMVRINEYIGDRDAAIAAVREQIRIYDLGLAGENNWHVRRSAMAAEYALARLLISEGADSSAGDLRSALEILEVASYEADALIQHDETNLNWRVVAVRQRLWLAQAQLLAGNTQAARQAYFDATAFMTHESWQRAEGARYDETRIHALLIEARLFVAMGDLDSAHTALDHLFGALNNVGNWQDDLVRGPYLYAAGSTTLAAIYDEQGDAAAAAEARRMLVETLTPIADRLSAGATSEYLRARSQIQQEMAVAE